MQGRNPAHAKGVDVSNNNGSVDFSAMVRAGVAWVDAKATEGATFHDPTFDAKYKAIKVAGLIRGAYCFARPETSTANDEATAYVDAVNKAGGFDGLPPALDMEVSAPEYVQFARDWYNRVKYLTGWNRKMRLYVGEYYAKEHLHGLTDIFDLWLADYSDAHPPDVAGWTEWTILQYTQNGSIAGHNGPLDFNEFNGTLDDLKKYCGLVKGGDTMQIKDSGPNVEKLQKDLKLILGLPDNLPNGKPFVDGVYGPATESAVKVFQLRNHLQEDGVVGPVTLGEINKQTAIIDAQLRAKSEAEAKQQAQEEAAAKAKSDAEAKAQAQQQAQYRATQLEKAQDLLGQAINILKNIQ